MVGTPAARHGVQRTRRAFGVAAATVLLAVVVAQAQTGPPTTLQESECWTCHRKGGTVEGQPLVAMYSLRPPSSLTLAAGEPTELRVLVRNEWLAELHNIAGQLDLSKAPSLAFTPPPEPVLGTTRTGTIPFTPTEVALDERSAALRIPVPVGATDLRLRLVPDRQGTVEAPDLTMRVWPEGIDPAPARAVEVDAAGKGEAEVLRLRDVDAIGRLGYGNWTVAAVQAGATAAPDASAFLEQPFTVVLDAWFNLTGDTTQVAASTARLDGRSDGPKETILTWSLFVRAPPADGEELLFTVNLVASFDHAAQFNAVDDWAFTQKLRVPIEVPEGPGLTQGPGGPVTIDLNTTPQQPTTVAADSVLFTGRIVGELVGYFTAFVMLASLVTGGVLGGASRRLLNAWIGSAQRRIAFHNLTSYGILLAAAAHTWVFIAESEFPWTLGFLWGGLAILALAVLGVTGAWQLPLIRRWGYTPWRIIHYGAAIGALLFTLVHMGLDGIHFTGVQESLGWKDPFSS